MEQHSGVPLTIRLIGAEGHDFGPSAAHLLGIGDRGAVAVRPDGHVLWRDPTGRNPGGLDRALKLWAGATG
ncbi:hypothetical protein [Paracoccus luteus]|uniref:aromatic-ring hydroxylase C-terminal domain-containing protein n=1 Tax=Paracoccus luteus TaxID=2508543 RepID=UPI00106F71B9|nr:hypothetical protein [Paracoccus luteus]